MITGTPLDETQIYYNGKELKKGDLLDFDITDGGTLLVNPIMVAPHASGFVSTRMSALIPTHMSKHMSTLKSPHMAIHMAIHMSARMCAHRCTPRAAERSRWM